MRTSRRFALVAVAGLGFAACKNPPPGDGVGRPNVERPDRFVPQGLALTEAFVAAPTAGERFVEILNTGTTALNLDGLSLSDGEHTTPLDGTVGAGETIEVPLGDLAPSPSVGELGVVDAEGHVEAYLAWGADPSTLGSLLAQNAIIAGVTTAGTFAPVGFPMPEGEAVQPTGCAPPSPGTPADPAAVDAAGCPVTVGVLLLNEIVPAAAPGEAAWVELANTSAEPVELTGVRLCQPPNCAVLPRDLVLEGGGFALVGLGGAAPESVGAPGEVVPSVALLNAAPLHAAGELGLLAPGGTDFRDPARLLDYVRFGAAASPLSDVAVAAGLWPEAQARTAPIRSPQDGLSRLVGAPAGPDAWVPAEPSPGAATADIGPTSDIWTACSSTRPWAPAIRSDRVIALVSRGSPARIVLKARDVEVASFDSVALRLVTPTSDTEATTTDIALFEHASLGPGGELVIEFLAAGETSDLCGAHLCVTDATLGSTGQAALVDTNTDTLIHYVQWGGGARDSALVDEAVAADLWPASRCATPEIPDGGALALDPDQDGTSPPDFSLE